MRIMIAGARGFIGQALTRRLAPDHDVLAISRSGPPAMPGVTTMALDVGDEDATRKALEGVEAAYYLVHSLDAAGGFSTRDRELAESFARAAAGAGVGRIVYLGGLGSGELSDHLRSRQETGEALAATGVPVVELRAAVILGSGSISFEMMRYLVERLPAMVCPRWVKTPIEPIALADMLAYLEQSLQVAPGIYEVGGARTTYRDLMQIYARVRGLRPRAILDVPLLTLNLSSYWVDFVTPVNRRISHSLIESLAIPVVVTDRETTDRAFSVQPVDVETAVRNALQDQSDDLTEHLPERPKGLADNVYVVRSRVPVDPEQAEAIRADLAEAGGDLRWYGIPVAWRLRLLLGRLIGEPSDLLRPELLEVGAGVDWWRVARWDGSVLMLRGEGWKSGDAWLAYEVASDSQPSLALHAAFRPRGIFGFLYWKGLAPIHSWAFQSMLRHRLSRVA